MIYYINIDMLILVGYYPGHDGFDYICVLCPENYTMSVDNCQGETITTSIQTTCRCFACILLLNFLF